MAKTNEKMTKKVAFEIALSLVEQSNHPDKAEVSAKLTKELEQIAKKSSATNGKTSAKQTANMGLGELVIAHLREHPNQMFTVTELMKAVPGLPEEITNQKLTAVMRLDSVKPFYTRTMDKGKAYFKYAQPAEVEDED